MTASSVKLVKIASAERSLRHVFIRDLVLACSIGVHRHEQEAPQRVRINLDLAVDEGGQPIDYDIYNAICYEHLAEGVGNIVGRGHVNLVETLVEDTAAVCLEALPVRSASARTWMLDVLAAADSVGMAIESRISKVWIRPF